MKSLLVGKEQGALTLCRFILQLVSAGLTTFTLLLLHEVQAAVLRWNRWTDRELEEEKGSGGGGKALFGNPTSYYMAKTKRPLLSNITVSPQGYS